MKRTVEGSFASAGAVFAAVISIVALVSLLLPLCVCAREDMIGTAAPAFTVESGKKEVFSSDELRGKVTVLFYESRNAVERNRPLKNSLNAFYARQTAAAQKDIVRLAVVYCRGVIFRGMWEQALRDAAEKEGMTIYGDWDGSVADAYGAPVDDSTVIVIDRKGAIRYYASGPAAGKDIRTLEALLKNLVNEK